VCVSTKPLITEESWPGQGLNLGIPNDTPALYPLLHRLSKHSKMVSKYLFYHKSDSGFKASSHFNPLSAACITDVRNVSHSARLARQRRLLGGMRQSSWGKSSVTAQMFASLETKGRCYDLNFRRFLPIFGAKMAFFSQTNVMITFLQKLAVV
jgi:hypothetical protein